MELFSDCWKIRDDIAPSGSLVFIYRPHISLMYKELNQMGGMGRNLHRAQIGQHHGK